MEAGPLDPRLEVSQSPTRLQGLSLFSIMKHQLNMCRCNVHRKFKNQDSRKCHPCWTLEENVILLTTETELTGRVMTKLVKV